MFTHLHSAILAEHSSPQFVVDKRRVDKRRVVTQDCAGYDLPDGYEQSPSFSEKSRPAFNSSPSWAPGLGFYTGS